MSSTSQYTDLLRSLDGMKNWRALGLVVSSFILAFAITAGAGMAGVAIGNATFTMIISVLAGLVGGLIAVFGSNAAGIVLMHQALDQPPPGIGEALLGGMASFFKLLAIGLIFVAAWLVFTLVSVILLFLCKIPYAGPVLYGVVFPILLVLSGAAYIGTVFGGGLMAPAIWRGATIAEALKQFVVIWRDHLVETVIRFLLLMLLLLVVFGVVYGILLAGAFYTVSLSAGIIGMGMRGGLLAMNSFSGSGHAIAMGVGTGIIGMLVAGSAFCAYAMGMITIYLAVSREIDTLAIDQRVVTDQEKQDFPAAAVVIPPPVIATPTSSTCPACHAKLSGDNAFCGECGQRL